MNPAIKLDKIDYHLLELLQTNAKVTNAYLSKEIGLSQAAVFERVKRMEACGLIKNYYAQLDTKKAGLGITFFIQISLASNKKPHIDAFLEKIDQIDEVIECHHITGSGNFLLKVISRDLTSFQELLMEKMSNIEEISNLVSMVVLSVVKDSKVMPIPMPDVA
ncbi:Lrp/AsnC family transcriptional regulator [Rhodocytophaga rosea]|uniref:Lrp/AsnC family transcriptional regulator n=1 Tax=Rhodocytophaga rosea TaxID=2704465 RepID=A0A6C0GJX6_9BACT|nr:Lrp/AsnC family transcriptional regulator [Rhodocytophaga rosea]QHT68259.1 Lrp/AsnC family transcriptional regulator [Rhodocytophaga rosea]